MPNSDNWNDVTIVASLYGFLYGIPFGNLNKHDQKLASEAIFLASLHREIED